VIGGVPVAARNDNQFLRCKGFGERRKERHDFVALGNAKRTAWQEIALHVYDQ
jgi:hypothetical protein